MLLVLGRMGRGHHAVNNAPSNPFDNDSNTYWWDFTSTDNIIDTVGDDTYSYIPEQLAGSVNLEQITKDNQPLVDANGADFGNASSRRLDADSVAGMNAAATGFYIAVNVRWDTAYGGIIYIAGSPDIWVYLTGSRLYGVKLDNVWKMYSTSRTLGQWYTLEIKIDTVADTLTLWIDGVETTAQYNVPGTLNTFGTVDSIVQVGYAGKSLDGSMQHLIIQNSLISDDARTSISDYLVSVRP